jgi:myosin-5
VGLRLNDNSSRFGKFQEVVFSPAYQITGARVNKYLLEKSRVVEQAEGETNYHIFFYIVNGAPPRLAKSLGLLSAEMYAFLKQADGRRDRATDPAAYVLPTQCSATGAR